MKDDFPVLRIRYAEDSPRIDSHTHPACELIFVREGEVRIRIDGRQYLAGPGTLTLIGALEQHELEVVKQPYIRHFCILSRMRWNAQDWTLFWQVCLKTARILSATASA